jgi:aminopeptidase N
MTVTQRPTIRLTDYEPPAYIVDRVELRFDLGVNDTHVATRLHGHRHPRTEPGEPMWLDGEALELRHIARDGEPLDSDAYERYAEGLYVNGLGEQFQLDIETRIDPANNTRLEGLYRSGGMFCTQCEAEGFRRITYFPDRPDIMARFSVTITADREECPVLLSNGNPVARGERAGNRHWVRWEDPFPKPSYLFALVAGDLHCHEDSHRTRSGRDIRLAMYTEHSNAGRTEHAMQSLKAAMAWDEHVYGLECDLDHYLVVAVADFNMGAMENKGLNVFNTQFVLARSDRTTDTDYVNIQDVVAHEYFHNWTGNRVTLRDWFQLSLKEGLTVFREQQFSADQGAAAVKRIQAVRTLRSAQFPEDSGPMAHPVRPPEYQEINNFYTPTVYLKGAEVIRMYHTLLGDEGFRRGMDYYFHRHDGQAVTCEDFLAAMADANNVDLQQFKRWYEQAGTPQLEVSDDYDAHAARYRLHISQTTAPTPGQPEKQPFHIPVLTSLLGRDGQPLTAPLDGGEARTEHCLELRAAAQTFVFDNVPQRPVPSLLRGFSAPVTLNYDYSDDDLAFLFANETDSFNRWEAGQRLATRILLRACYDGDTNLPDGFRQAFANTLTDTHADPALVAEALTLPSETAVGEEMATVAVDNIHNAREWLRRAIAESLEATVRERYDSLTHAGSGGLDAASVGQRRLRNVLLGYLAALEGKNGLETVLTHYDQAQNMTDTMAALSLLADSQAGAAEQRLGDFYQRWRADPLVVDKWFRVQAMSTRVDTLDQVRRLMRHEAFTTDNPNKVRALLGAFAQGNPVRFHEPSGAGYRFIADQVIELDARNPHVAATLVTPLSRWQRYDEHRGQLMYAELQRIHERGSLSNDVHEIVRKSLEAAQS